MTPMLCDVPPIPSENVDLPNFLSHIVAITAPLFTSHNTKALHNNHVGDNVASPNNERCITTQVSFSSQTLTEHGKGVENLNERNQSPKYSGENDGSSEHKGDKNASTEGSFYGSQLIENTRTEHGEDIVMVSPKSRQSRMTALMVTLGQHGLLVVRRAVTGEEDSPLMPSPAATTPGQGFDERGEVVGLHFPPPACDSVVSVSGAGDCLASGFIAGMLRGGLVSECAAAATRAALLSLQATAAVPPTLGAPSAVVGADRLAFTLVPHRD